MIKNSVQNSRLKESNPRAYNENTHNNDAKRCFRRIQVVCMMQYQEIVPGLTPTDSGVSYRQLLTKALELGQEGVKLDSTNNNTYATVVAYGGSVALLGEKGPELLKDRTDNNKLLRYKRTKSEL